MYLAGDWEGQDLDQDCEPIRGEMLGSILSHLSIIVFMVIIVFIIIRTISLSYMFPP